MTIFDFFKKGIGFIILFIMYLGFPGFIIWMIFIPPTIKPEVLVDNFSENTITVVFHNGEKKKTYSITDFDFKWITLKDNHYSCEIYSNNTLIDEIKLGKLEEDSYYVLNPNNQSSYVYGSISYGSYGLGEENKYETQDKFFKLKGMGKIPIDKVPLKEKKNHLFLFEEPPGSINIRSGGSSIRQYLLRQ